MEDGLQASEHRKEQMTQRKKVIIIISVVATLVALYFLLPVLLVVFVAQPVRVEGAAMSPTLNNGDRIFISKRVDPLQRGDIVVFYYPKDTTKSFIKRVVGLPGERIDIDSEGNVMINGQALKESYVQPERNQTAKARWNSVPAEWKQLGEDSYFILGDNRDASNDSRSYGPVSKKLIYGKYLMRYWSSSQ
ncbi:MAG TPA: signal peptidase I [Candidatus Saccharimonadales bacterium]|nr:signal peptidase I [Candidatus Saccharimonadales bacterium]